MKHLLDNIMWHALTGPHAVHAVGTGCIRRYARGFSPIVGFADPHQPDLQALARFCESGEHFYCEGWSGPEHAQQAQDLAALTRPGPFGPRTIELGEYFGCFEGSRLVAMAGERMQAGAMREISGVCTHPDFQGRGHARRLMLKLIQRQMLRHETPFLHVMRDNAAAHQLYQRMGFGDYREAVVRVIAPA